MSRETISNPVRHDKIDIPLLGRVMSQISTILNRLSDAVDTPPGRSNTVLVIENRTSDPVDPDLGRIWLRTDTGAVRISTPFGIKTVTLTP